MMSNGAVTQGTLDGLLLMMNGKFLKGLFAVLGAGKAK